MGEVDVQRITDESSRRGFSATQRDELLLLIPKARRFHKQEQFLKSTLRPDLKRGLLFQPAGVTLFQELKAQKREQGKRQRRASVAGTRKRSTIRRPSGRKRPKGRAPIAPARQIRSKRASQKEGEGPGRKGSSRARKRTKSAFRTRSESPARVRPSSRELAAKARTPRQRRQAEERRKQEAIQRADEARLLPEDLNFGVLVKGAVAQELVKVQRAVATVGAAAVFQPTTVTPPDFTAAVSRLPASVTATLLGSPLLRISPVPVREVLTPQAKRKMAKRRRTKAEKGKGKRVKFEEEETMDIGGAFGEGRAFPLIPPPPPSGAPGLPPGRPGGPRRTFVDSQGIVRTRFPAPRGRRALALRQITAFGAETKLKGGLVSEIRVRPRPGRTKLPRARNFRAGTLGMSRGKIRIVKKTGDDTAKWVPFTGAASRVAAASPGDKQALVDRLNFMSRQRGDGHKRDRKRFAKRVIDPFNPRNNAEASRLETLAKPAAGKLLRNRWNAQDVLGIDTPSERRLRSVGRRARASGTRSASPAQLAQRARFAAFQRGRTGRIPKGHKFT